MGRSPVQSVAMFPKRDGLGWAEGGAQQPTLAPLKVLLYCHAEPVVRTSRLCIVAVDV